MIMSDVIVIFWADVIAPFFLFDFEIFGRCYAKFDNGLSLICFDG